jgi:hypothetical protein
MQTGYVTAVQTADVSEFMLRLNFGLAMIKRHKVCAVEGYVVHNFHMTYLKSRKQIQSSIDVTQQARVAQISNAHACTRSVNQ